MPIRILYGEVYEVQFKSIDSDAPGDISLVYGFDTQRERERERDIYYEENFKYIKQTHPPTHPPTQIRMRSERR